MKNEMVQTIHSSVGIIQQESKKKLLFKKYKYYYILLIPMLLHIIIFKYIPMLGVVIAFNDYNFSGGIFHSPWVGFKWFQELFSNGEFINVISNTLIISIYKIIFCFPAPIFLALLINEVKNKIYKRGIQTVIYFPHFLSWVIIGGIMFTFFSSSTGIFSTFGISSNFLMDPKSFRSLLVFSQMWKETGWGTVVYLAAISSISPDLYEAAKIDGANRFQQAIYITLPSIASTIVVLLILRTGTILFAGFEQIYILTNPLVTQVSDVIDTYVFRNGLQVGRFSYATAAGLFQSAVGLIIVLLTNWFARRIGEKGLW